MEFKSRSSSNFALPDADGLGLCRVLGLAISNVSMYGMEHSVTASSVAAAYDELLGKVDNYGEIEFVLEDSGMIINGSKVDTERTTGQLFVAQLNKLGVHDFAFISPLNRPDFNKFISIIAAPPGSEFATDGFEAAVNKANLQCVRVRNVSYARVDKDADLSKMNFDDCGGCGEGSGSGGGSGSGSGGGESGASSAGGGKSYDLGGLSGSSSGGSSGGSKVFDLDLELDAGMGGMGDIGDLGGMGGGIGGMGLGGSAQVMDSAMLSDAHSYIEKKRSSENMQQRLINKIRAAGSAQDRRNIKEQLMGVGFTEGEWLELLSASTATSSGGDSAADAVETLCRIKREVEDLVAQGKAVNDGKSSSAMSNVLGSIAQEVARITSQAKGDISTLAGKVDADRETIARVEDDARASGIGLNLSRDELLESLAEINQELSQSLTVVSSVTDILVSEKMGEVTAAQHDVLKVAAEGVNKIQKLVSYLNTLSGFPETLSPDRNLLDEAYGV